MRDPSSPRRSSEMLSGILPKLLNAGKWHALYQAAMLSEELYARVSCVVCLPIVVKTAVSSSRYLTYQNNNYDRAVHS